MEGSMKSKKGNLYVAVVIALVIWIAGILILPFIVDDINSFRVNMDCSNSSISNTGKLVCLAGDSLVPYFIWTLVSIALGFISGGRV